MNNRGVLCICLVWGLILGGILELKAQEQESEPAAKEKKGWYWFLDQHLKGRPWMRDKSKTEQTLPEKIKIESVTVEDEEEKIEEVTQEEPKQEEAVPEYRGGVSGEETFEEPQAVIEPKLAQVYISSPASGALVIQAGEVIPITGTATSEEFSQYQITYQAFDNLTNTFGRDEIRGIRLANYGAKPINEGMLGSWDTSVVRDKPGWYRIRLTVYGNEEEGVGIAESLLNIVASSVSTELEKSPPMESIGGSEEVGR